MITTPTCGKYTPACMSAGFADIIKRYDSACKRKLLIMVDGGGSGAGRVRHARKMGYSPSTSGGRHVAGVVLCYEYASHFIKLDRDGNECYRHILQEDVSRRLPEALMRKLARAGYGEHVYARTF